MSLLHDTVILLSKTFFLGGYYSFSKTLSQTCLALECARHFVCIKLSNFIKEEAVTERLMNLTKIIHKNSYIPPLSPRGNFPEPLYDSLIFPLWIPTILLSHATEHLIILVLLVTLVVSCMSVSAFQHPSIIPWERTQLLLLLHLLSIARS